MKEKFETYLKKDQESAGTIGDQEAFELIERTVDKDTRDLILELQVQKLDFVKNLKRWRKKFWSKEVKAVSDQRERAFEEQPGAWELQYRDDNTFVTHTKGGDKITLSIGEILAAHTWGFWWKFDQSVPAEFQKKIMSNQVRKIVAAQYDNQLVQLGKVNRLSDDRKRDTYERIEEVNFNLETMPTGILAEKMLLSFLTKKMFDADLPFSVAEVDVYEDVEHKIDFIITVANTRRGVKVDEPKQQSHIGIQFTMNTGATERKERQLNRVRSTALHEAHVDELVLITMPINDIRPAFERWRYEADGTRLHSRKLDPRGPDNLWSEETKEQIFLGLVKGIESLNTTYQ